MSPCIPSFSLRLQGEPVDWFVAEHRSRWSKSRLGVEVLGVRIFWMNGELERLALRMIAPDELKKEAERLCSISSSLVVVVDKEVEDPVVVRAPRLVREFGKSHHLRCRIKDVGDPNKSSWTKNVTPKKERKPRISCSFEIVHPHHSSDPSWRWV